MISIEVKGLEEAKQLLAYLHDLGNVVQAAEVQGHKRKESKNYKGRWAHYQDNNAGVLELMGMEPGNRDFWSLDEEEKKTVVDKPFIDELWESVQKIASKPVMVAGKIKSQASYASQAMGNALKAACMSYLRWITANINDQNWKGSGGSDLNPEYAKRKQRKFGFTHPIGKASGQVIDNVAPSKKNIKLIRNQ